MALALAPTFEEGRWVPSPDHVADYRISQFLASTGLPGMAALTQRAAADPDWYFPAVHDFLGLPWMVPWKKVRDSSQGEPFTKWFIEGRTNLAWLAVDRWAGTDGTALIWEREDGVGGRMSFAELEDAVARAAGGLRRLGIGFGDVVGIFLPYCPEAVIAILAVARIGAIAAPAFSGYGIDAVADRLAFAQAKLLITADGTVRRGRQVPMLDVAMGAAEKAGITRVVVVSRMGHALPPGSGVLPWTALTESERDGRPQPFETDTPWLLTFTSGSTGKPKGAVHTHGGLGYGMAIEMGLNYDVRPGDRLLWPADIGWLGGSTHSIGPLVLGATAVLFEGVLNAPGPDYVWRLIEREGVTQFGASPTLIRMLASDGGEIPERFDMPTLRILMTSSEPITPAAWRWLHRHVGRGHRPIINGSGGTEAGGLFLTCYPNTPVAECRFSGPNLGIAADVVDETGTPVTGSIGELVIRRSWPSMTRGLWREPERYLEQYWSKRPGMWSHGDQVIRYADGSFEIVGRADDVLKVAGKRVGPAELEKVATQEAGVLAAAAVSVPHPVKGNAAVVVVTTERDHCDPTLPSRVADRIESSLGRAMRPAAVVIVDELPSTGTGKIHRRALRDMLAGRDDGELAATVSERGRASIARAQRHLRELLGTVE